MYAWLATTGSVGASGRDGVSPPVAHHRHSDTTKVNSVQPICSQHSRTGECRTRRLRQFPRLARCRASSNGAKFQGIKVGVPSIGYSLADTQESLGAVFDDSGVAQTFGNSEAVDAALREGVAVFDRSHWGRFRVTGTGCLPFLHGQSTNTFNELRPGQGCETVFVTATARTIDLASTYVQDSGVMVIVSPGMGEAIMDRLDRYIFRGDDVELQDVTGRCSVLSVIGPGANALLEGLGATRLGEDAACCHRLLDFGGRPVMVAVGGGLSQLGYTLVVDEGVAAELYGRLCDAGAVPGGEEDWQRARVLDGRPAAGSELTEDYNPLEAGLYRAVSADKGCYVGQETIARVDKNNAVKQQLWGLRLSGPAKVGEPITKGAKRLGRVTSCVRGLDGRYGGLGYLRCRDRGTQVDVDGWEVLVGDNVAKVVSIPFATRAFEPSEDQDGEADAAGEADGSKEEEEAARQERMKALQDRLAAWKAQQEAQ